MLPKIYSLQIDSLIQLVREEFRVDSDGESLLPIIVVYSLYQCLTRETTRLENKRLVARYTNKRWRQNPIGVIEVIGDNGEPIEVLVIRNRETITRQMIQSTLRKSRRSPIRRYYFLTTAEPFVKQREQENIQDIVQKMQIKYNCEIFIDGVLPTLKYYLRAISVPALFWQKYCDNQKLVPLSALDPKKTHLKKWKSIMKQIIASN